MKQKFKEAIARRENYYKTPYARTSDGKGHLHIEVICTDKAAEACSPLADELAVGFAEWCDASYKKLSETIWKHKYSGRPTPYTTQQLLTLYKEQQ